MSAARSVATTLQYAGGAQLVLYSKSLRHGCWSSAPADTVDAGATADWATESCGIMAGVEGYVVYCLGGLVNDRCPDDKRVKLSFDNPYIGSNEYSVSVPTGCSGSYSGGDGNDSHVTYAVACA